MGIETLSFPSTRALPTYLIQPCLKTPTQRNPRIDLLLGDRLDTTSFALGRPNERRGGLKLHIKSDAPGGIGIQGIRVANPYDAVGTALWRGGGEYVRSMQAGFVVSVGITMETDDHINMQDLRANGPTLVVDRGALLHRNIAPELRGAPADSYGGRRPKLIPHEFGTLVDAVRSNIKAERYFLINR